MDKTKKLILSAVFLAVVMASSLIAASFLSPKAEAEETSVTVSAEESDETETEEEIPHGSTRLGVNESSVIIDGQSSGRELTDEEKEKYPQLTNLPVLYIELDGNRKIHHITHDTWLGATYTLVDGDFGIVEQPFEIKGRGNYSWSMSKKPYAVKLAEGASLLGMGKGKNWILIANWSDKTLMRNYLTMQLARNIGLEYSSDCRYVDVYFNGKYHGNYVLTEKITLGSNRVDIDPNIGGLFEIEMTYRHSDCTWCIDLPSGVHVMYKEPDEEDYGTEWKKNMLTKFRSLFTKADISITSKGYEYYSRYIDVDSFIDWYIVNEFVKNYDSGFTTSCYCYVKEDGKIYMGPVWDYDTCMGNQAAATCVETEGYHVGTSPWYDALLHDEDFFRMLCERWTFLIDSGAIQENFFDLMTKTDEYIADSSVENFKIWRDAEKFDGLRGSSLSTYSHSDEVAYVRNWMTKRMNWLSSQWYIGK
ncbi:MAG: CotH kinase family protein [Eubacteriales bacterium]